MTTVDATNNRTPPPPLDARAAPPALQEKSPESSSEQTQRLLAEQFLGGPTPGPQGANFRAGEEAHRAATVLNDHFTSWDLAAGIGDKDDIVSGKDLLAVARSEGNKYSREEKAAARYIVEHPDLMKSLTVGGQPEGGSSGPRAKIGKEAAADWLTLDKEPKLDERQSLGVMSQNYAKWDTASGIGKRDGIVSDKDLRAVAFDRKAPAAERAAAYRILNDDKLLKTLGGSDKKISELDFYKHYLDQNQSLGLMDQNYAKWDTAAGIGKRDGIVSDKDLRAVCNDSKAPPMERAAAFNILGDDKLMKRLGGDQKKIHEETFHQYFRPNPPGTEGYVNHTPGGKAAMYFNQKFGHPPSDGVRATREDLGLGPKDVLTVDVGGEGQKLDPDYGFSSGNLYALNLNAQSKISPGHFDLSTEPGARPTQVGGNSFIPNHIGTSKPWTRSPDYPLADGVTNGTMLEGAPLTDKNIKEMARITRPDGWIYLNVVDQNAQAYGLAREHNGRGTMYDLGDGRFLIPPSGYKGVDPAKWTDSFGHPGVTNENFNEWLTADHSKPRDSRPPHDEF